MSKKLTEMESYQEEQVILSKERTILSFMQVGLTFVTAGIVISNFFSQTYVQIVGYVLIVIGFVEVFESMRRLHRKQKEMTLAQEKVKVHLILFHLGPCGESSTAKPLSLSSFLILSADAKSPSFLYPSLLNMRSEISFGSVSFSCSSIPRTLSKLITSRRPPFRFSFETFFSSIALFVSLTRSNIAESASGMFRSSSMLSSNFFFAMTVLD